MSEYIPTSEGKFFCVGCRCELPLDFRAEGSNRCQDCQHAKETNEGLIRQDGLMTKATENLVAAIADRVMGQGPNDEMIGRFFNRFNPEEIGDKAAELCETVLTNATLPGADLKLMREGRNWVKLADAMSSRRQKEIEERRKALSQLDQEDLRALLRPLAIELCKSDPDFLSEVMDEAMPGRILEMA